MLEYDGWGSNPSPMMCSVDDLTHDSPHPHSIIVDNYAGPGHHSAYGSHFLPTGGVAAAFSPFYGQQPTPGSFQPLYDSRSYGAPSYSTAPAATFSLDSFHGSADSFLVPVPKTEEVVVARSPAVDWLNLGTGGRTYFSSAEDDIISRLYRRSRQLEPSGGGVKVPRCQAEGCNADLTHAKHYHRRHKVCEFHSKAAAVMAAGQTQRFCQQCSRFHLLSEFDNGKRSCRKRLADHNRRRRKSQLPNNPEIQKPHVGRSPTINGLAKSPQESAAADQSSSSVTVAAASPPRMSLDCFRQSQPANYHHQSAASASSSPVSSRSLFFSTSTNY